MDAVSVENPVRPGTPDINYIEGWIELKYLEKWPVRTTTPVKIAHYTSQQKVWLTRRIKKGGNASLLLKVGNKDWILLGLSGILKLGSLTKEELINISLQYWNKKPKEHELCEALRSLPEKNAKSLEDEKALPRLSLG